MHDENLVQRFHQAMLEIYEAATKLKPAYRPNYFRSLVMQHGGKGAADILLSSQHTSTGFTELLMRGEGALKLSVEYLVLSDPWRQLFSEEQLAIASDRLLAVGCELPENMKATNNGVGNAEDFPPNRPLVELPPAVRILPMSAELEFPSTTIKQLQDDFFLRELPFSHPCGEYYFRNSGLDAPSGSVVLFQFDNHLVASAILVSSTKFVSPLGEYSGSLSFLPPSIKVFNPIDVPKMKSFWPNFQSFSQVKQSLPPEPYPEFVKSLVDVRTPEGTILNPGEELPKEVLIEGGKTRVMVDAYERNWKARQACLVFHGTACVICGFDFSKVYGEIAKDFIHVHHVKAICEQDGPYEVDPQKDLVPVCPNCHAVLHMKTPCYKVDEVKSLLRLADRDRS
jgi:hypothetical protein